MNILHRVKYKDVEQITQLKIIKEFKQEFQGSSPAPFIGRFGYPYVNVGILSPQIGGDTSYYDSPLQWSQQNTSIHSIAALRSELVNSRLKWNIKQLNGHFLEICQDVGMAAKPVELEVQLKKIPALKQEPDNEITPFGPQAEVQKAVVTVNPTIDKRVERVVYDTDLKAGEALFSLYQKGFAENFLHKILSVGNIGIEKNRKLVPTRWSITAVDDTVGKQLIEEVKNFPVGEYTLYFGGGWGNYYLLLFMPEIWSYELFETYLNKIVNPWSKNGYAYSTDYEDYHGRKTSAEECAGGYYACRLPVVEKMKELHTQQAVLALRFITSEYSIPLGVWVCREATRKSLQEQPLHFASQELMLQYAAELMKRKFNFDLNLLLKESKLLKNKKEQKKLTAF